MFMKPRVFFFRMWQLSDERGLRFGDYPGHVDQRESGFRRWSSTTSTSPKPVRLDRRSPQFAVWKVETVVVQRSEKVGTRLRLQQHRPQQHHHRKVVGFVRYVGFLRGHGFCLCLAQIPYVYDDWDERAGGKKVFFYQLWTNREKEYFSNSFFEIVIRFFAKEVKRRT